MFEQRVHERSKPAANAAASLQGKWVGESSMETTMKATNSGGRTIGVSALVRLIRSGITSGCKCLHWQETCNGAPAPCLESEKETLGDRV